MYVSSNPQLLVQREGKALPEASLPFHRAMPSLTHMALVELEKAGILKFLISQVWLHYFLNCISDIIPLGNTSARTFINECLI